MYLITGLGNPGAKYDYTRHNAGFMFIDYFAMKHGIPMKKIKFKGIVGDGTINGEKVILLKPSTFMNLSGTSVVEAMNFYKIPIDRLLVVFDDISLELGRMRIREKGSAGGHNGIKNIIYLLGADNFKRIKLGVGTEALKQKDLADFVLDEFSKEELKKFSQSVENAASATEYIIGGNTVRAMNLYNS